MKFIGNIAAVCTITGRGMAIITDRETGIAPTRLFPGGTELELKTVHGAAQRVHVRSAELALRQQKDDLSFILMEEITQEVLESLTEIWCDDKITR
jgi:hypothetical protein